METKVYHQKKSNHKNNGGSYTSNDKKPKVVSVNSKKDKERENYKPVSRTKNIEPHIHSLQKFSNYKWEELDLNNLYREFKEIEGYLKNILDV